MREWSTRPDCELTLLLVGDVANLNLALASLTLSTESLHGTTSHQIQMSSVRDCEL
jgi:hypothetical protein